MGKTIAKAPQNINKVAAAVAQTSNDAFLQQVLNNEVTLENQAAQNTLAYMREKGFEGIKNITDAEMQSNVIGVLLGMVIDRIRVPRARNPFIDEGIMEVFDFPYGGIARTILIGGTDSVNPGFLPDPNNERINPFITTPNNMTEQYYGFNAPFQCLKTIAPLDYKTVLTSEFGYGEIISGLLQSMANAYTEHEDATFKAVFNAAVNSTTSPLQNSQRQGIPGWIEGQKATVDNLKSLIRRTQNVVRKLRIMTQSSLYNAMGYRSAIFPEDLVLMIRSDIVTDIDLDVMSNTFHDKYMNFPVKVVEFDDIGGMIPYKDESMTTQLYPVYSDDTLGRMLGYSEQENQKGENAVTVGKYDAFLKDGNSRIKAMLVEKGVIREHSQNPFVTRTIFNPRNEKTNYWGNRVNVGINYDKSRTLVTFETVTN